VAKETLKVPDIGGAEDAEVIEVYVAVGDTIELEQSLIALESDKASMEIPASSGGTVVEVLVKVGDTLAEGAALVVIETAATEVTSDAAQEPAQEPVQEVTAEPEAEESAEPPVTPASPQPATASAEIEITVPDIGSTDPVEVIELLVAVGDSVSEGDSLLVLESDKASMEIPAPFTGEIVSLAVAVGAEVVQGQVIGVMAGAAPAAAAATPVADAPAVATQAVAAPAPAETTPAPVQSAPVSDTREPEPAFAGGKIYAGPAVRKLAREFGVELGQVTGSGPKNRILKEDIQAFVKRSLEGGAVAAAGSVSGGSGIPAIPLVDFSSFGAVDIQPLTKMDKLTAANMQRSWLNVPHVTQFDEADITALEDFRAELKAEAERRGVKLTPLPFLLKACAAALRDNVRLNASLAGDGENIVYKQYIHIGMAVDTPAGLVVPVVRDVDQKSLWQLAAETAELAQKAKERKLKPNEMQGGCFTISSLGNIGGTGFTPIVNAPEVAILGVSKLAVKPVWDGAEFQPRKMLPLALSYDHRVVNGGDGGRFMTQLVATLADIRRLLL